MIIQPQTCASGRGNDASVFFFFLVGALRKLRTLRIGSGGTVDKCAISQPEIASQSGVLTICATRSDCATSH